MVKESKPKAGSLQFWPRKRARRIYPLIKYWPGKGKFDILGFAGYKVGMLQVFLRDNKKGSPTFGQEISVPATLIEVPPLLVMGLCFYQKTFYGMKKVKTLLFDKLPEEVRKKIERKQKLPKKEIKFEPPEKYDEIRFLVSTQPWKAGIGKKTPEIFEIATSLEVEKAKEKFGKEISLDEVFKEGEYVDVTSITKGHGFTGVVKRFGVKILGRKSKRGHRRIGSIGPRGYGKVMWQVPRPGQYGFFQRTEYNKQILKFGKDAKEINPKAGWKNYGLVKGDYVIVKGSVPGPTKRLIFFRKSKVYRFSPLEITDLVIE